MASIKKDYNSMGLPMNINRSNPIPVDCTELWYSLEEAQNYAQNDPRAYVGQSVKVVENNTVTVYIIEDTAGNLMQLADIDSVGSGGSDIDNTIVVDEFLSISGAAADAKVVGDAISKLNIDVATKIDTPESAEVGQVLSVKSVDENGKITWETISPQAADNLETTPEDIIEWMSEENIITPLASSSGEVYLTNDNKIIIL